MAKILEPKIKASGLMDSFELAIMKTLAEKTLQPIVGNSTLVSGGVKLVAGGALSGVSGNKHVGLLSSALVVDGVEDAAHALLGKVLGTNDRAGGAWNQ